jgi:hypothetical protein
VSDLVCGKYKLQDGGQALQQPFTGQSLALHRDPTDPLVRLLYTDRDVSLPIAVMPGTKRGGLEVLSAVTLNANLPASAALCESYGLWRRVAGFLLDALPIWCLVSAAAAGRPAGARVRGARVRLIGGWGNGRWRTDAAIEAHMAISTNDLKAFRTTTEEPESAEALFPLDVRPIAWAYMSGHEPPDPEVVLATDGTNGQGVPVLRQDLPIGPQLAGAPYYLRTDGGAWLHHRYIAMNFHRGEDYDPVPVYGYLNRDCGFSLGAQPFHGVSPSPDDLVLPRADMRREAVMRSAWLRPKLHEELFFALCDISALQRDLGWSHGPMIRHAESDHGRNWPGRRFGSNLNRFQALPFTAHVGQSGTHFLSAQLIPATQFGEIRTRTAWAGFLHWLRRKLFRRRWVFSLYRRLR